MTPDNGWLETGDARLYYEVAGRGEPVVLVHGNSLDHRMWDDQFQPLAKRYRAVRYDLRGFGRSSVPTGAPYSPSEDLRALLDHLEVERAHVVGLSLGGARAIDFALTHPDSVHTLVLADSGISGFPFPGFGAFYQRVLQAGAEDGVDAAREVWMAGALFASARERPAVARRLAAMIDDYSGWHWVNGSEKASVYSDAPARLGRIDCPTLVLVGERDEADFQAVADLLHREVPNARRVDLPTGHMSNMEAPERFNDALFAFLAAHSMD